jgi:hypothetical protein
LKQPFLSTTDGYHKHELDSLCCELTVSMMLEDPRSLCRSILRKSASFGDLLYNFLAGIIPMESLHSFMEIGGGYGYLARDFLKKNSNLRVIMVDISPFLLEQQRQTLRGFDAKFVQADFLELKSSILSGIDLAVLNEVMGDHPTVCGLSQSVLCEDADPEDELIREVRSVCHRYGIDPPARESFALNLGAIRALERLCLAHVPHIYASEHSCEASVPEQLKGMLDLQPAGDPERIRLRGHDEYTIRFSDLVKVARFFGYSIRRGQYIDFIEPVIEGEVSFVLALGSSRVDRYEIIMQFIEDLAKYEYMVMSLSSREKQAD